MHININLTPTEEGNYLGCLVVTQGHKFVNPETEETFQGLGIIGTSPFDVFKQLMGKSNTMKEIEMNIENP